MNRPAYTPPSVPKACPWKLRGVVRGLLCFYLALSIAFIPLDFRFVGLGLADTPTLEVQRNEAHALVPVGAGGAAAAAAALGLTETQLACGMAVCLAAGAGLYLYYNASTDLSQWPTDKAWPGFKPWDDLTPAEKQNWVGQDGDVGDYWQSQLDLYTLNYGLWDYDSQGNPQPTPEPEDPDDKEKWFTKNNVITALGTGAAVGLGTIASTLVSDVANSLADMLFGTGSTDLGLNYLGTVTVNNKPVNFVSLNAPNADWKSAQVQGKKGNNGKAVRYTYSGAVTITNYNENVYRVNAVSGTYYQWYDGDTSQFQLTGSLSANMLAFNSDSTSQFVCLNPMMQYTFPGGQTYSAGAWTGTGVNATNADYDQMQGTPNEIVNNIFNNPSYIENVSNYANTGNDTQKAAQMPTFFNGANGEPLYSDFVKTMPNDDVTVIPDDRPINDPTPGPGPGPDPGPGPYEPNEYQQDYGDKVAELLAQPFDQLFPFCLIGDLRVFTQKVNSAFNGNGLTRSEPNYDELVIPLEDFNVDGLENITFDLLPLKGMGAVVKSWINALLVVALLIGSFRFFLNRGGE